MPSEITEEIGAKIQIAAYRILQAITPRRQAQYAMGISAALAMAATLDPGLALPPELATLAAGLGTEPCSSPAA